ncbi:MAG: P-loop containing nucleoside triphosphate hydrolase protein [Monoraphidium minutum]|nr:MAG: P-loop containing nucleoside triphosphate hydrolase protein [Monoraphidium minutum]
MSYMQSNPLGFQTQDGMLTANDGTAAGLTAAFHDFGTSQADSYLQFTDFGHGNSQGSLAWNDGLGAAPARQQQGAGSGGGYGGLDGLATSLNQLRFDEGFEDASGTQTPGQLPEWACAYCGIHNPASVVKCCSTGKWFCNGKMGSSGSCIVVHLVRSRCREVQLHRDSPLGDAVLECYNSGARNIFVLGFVPVRSDNTVVLLARDTPPNAPAVKDLGVDMSQWQPIVEGRAFVPWLVKPPGDDERLRARRLTPQQIGALEELWKARPEAGLDDLEAAEEEGGGGGKAAELMPVALRYDDAAQYQSVFHPLIAAEAEHDRSMREQQRREGITVRWDTAINKRRLALFYFPQDDVEVKLLPGDELRLRHKSAGAHGAWEGTGHVVGVANGISEEVQLEMDKGDVPDDVTAGFSLEFVWKSTTFDRFSNAMKLFRDYTASISGYLFHCVLGHPVEPLSLRILLPSGGCSAPNLPELNHSQLHAVRSVLQQPLSLIQGPPGTGKTVTSATTVYHLSQATGSQVLVAAPSNVAVDQLAEKVAATGLKVVRVCAKTREAVASPVEHLTLHYQVAHLDLPGADMLRKLQLLKAEKGGLSATDERQFLSIRRALEKEILAAADVVCCTCVGAGDPRLTALRFQHVLVDEATQATEPEALMPLVLGAKQVILVGDHCQLGPVIMCKRAAEAGLSLSLFERLRLLGCKPLRLQVQYRMHPCLSEFPSNTFYEGALQNGAGAGDRRAPAGLEFPWPNPDKPMMFWSQLGAEEISASGTSYLNRTEATNVEKLLTRFLQCGVNPHQLGVITPYEGQRAHVTSTLVRQGPLRQDLYRAVEVSSVDAFQGREKDYIIVSCVRSNEAGGIGFLGDPRRLNVALTRARYGLVLLGNPRVLARSPLWGALLAHFKEQELLVEGPLTNLKPSLAQLPQPKRRFDRAAFGIDSAPGLGGLGAVGRFHPTARVGDPLPHTAHEGGGGSGSGGGGGAAAGLGAGDPVARPGFSPFLGGPSCAIPAPGVIGGGGAKPRRPGGGGGGGGGLGAGLSDASGLGLGASQLGLGLQTQIDMGGSLGGGGNSFLLGGLGGFGTQDFGTAASQGGASQADGAFLGLSQALGGGGGQGRPG